MLSKSLLGVACMAAMTPAADLRLADAAMQGDRSAVRALLAQKAEVNAAQGDGMTALHWAASKNDLEMARMLLRVGANVKAETRLEAITPLLLASTSGNAAMIEEMLKAGADPNSTNGAGTTALMAAAASGSADAVALLLEHGADVNRTESARGQTALMFAASLNRASAIKILTAHGAKMTVTSNVSKLQKVRFDEDGNPLPAPSRTATGGGAANSLNTGAAAATVLGGLTALSYAARDGKMDAVRALLEAGADINGITAGDHSSPIVLAIANGHFDLADYLLNHGADPNLANLDGLAPLYAAIDCQWAPVAWQPVPITDQEKTTYLELMKSLLEKGADPNARINRPLWFRPVDHNQMWVRAGGSTAFWRAAQATDMAAMKLLMAHGADPKIQSTNKDTALAMAAGVGWAGNFSTNAPDQFMASVKYLVDDLGIDVNVQDIAGYTAVMGAAYRGDNEMVQYLVSKGARLDVHTARGWSVTDMANGPSLRTSVPVSHPDTVALLVTAGAPELTKVEGEEILGIIKGKAPAAKQDR